MIEPITVICQALSIHGDPCTRPATGCYTVGRGNVQRVLCHLCARALAAGGTPAIQDYLGNVRTWATFGTYRPQIKVSGGDSFPKPSTHGPPEVSAPGVEAKASQRAETRSSLMDRDAGTPPPDAPKSAAAREARLAEAACNWMGCDRAIQYGSTTFCGRDKSRAYALFGTSSRLTPRQIADAPRLWAERTAEADAKQAALLVETTKKRLARRREQAGTVGDTCQWRGCENKCANSVTWCRTCKSRAIAIFGTSTRLTAEQVAAAPGLWAERAYRAAGGDDRDTPAVQTAAGTDSDTAEFWRVEHDRLRKQNADLREDAYQAELRKPSEIDTGRRAIALHLIDCLDAVAVDDAPMRALLSALRLAVT